MSKIHADIERAKAAIRAIVDAEVKTLHARYGIIPEMIEIEVGRLDMSTVMEGDKYVPRIARVTMRYTL